MNQQQIQIQLQIQTQMRLYRYKCGCTLAIAVIRSCNQTNAIRIWRRFVCRILSRIGERRRHFHLDSSARCRHWGQTNTLSHCQCEEGTAIVSPDAPLLGLHMKDKEPARRYQKPINNNAEGIIKFASLSNKMWQQHLENRNASWWQGMWHDKRSELKAKRKI